MYNIVLLHNRSLRTFNVSTTSNKKKKGVASSWLCDDIVALLLTSQSSKAAPWGYVEDLPNHILSHFRYP